MQRESESESVCVRTGDSTTAVAREQLTPATREHAITDETFSVRSVSGLKSLLKRHGPREPTAIRGPSGLKFHPSEKANAIADCLENQFTHDLCDENHERRLEARVQTMLEAADSKPHERIRPCDLQKLLSFLKLRKSCGIDDIPNECLRQLPRQPLVHLTHLFNHCLRLPHFPKSWKEAKIITLPKPGKDPKFPQNLRPLSLLSTTGKLFEKVILKKLSKSIYMKEACLMQAS
jgi:hypothetical protein